MTSFLHIIGINFKSAPLEQVARVQWSETRFISQFLGQVRECFQIEEAFFLQTCNRREFYFFAPDMTLEGPQFKVRFLDALSQSLNETLDHSSFYHHQNEECALHLFSVASSLDSMVLGETEIMKQIKDQASRAGRKGHVNRRIKALLETALWSARQVRTRTHITKNVVSMASLIYRKVREHHGKRLVVVGAGHYIQSIMPTFAKAQELDLIFVNRTYPEALANEYGGTAMTLADFIANPIPFDAMVTATGAPHTVFTHEWLAQRNHPMLLLDAALPRDIEPSAEDLPGVHYMDLSQMEDVLSRNRAAREAEIPKTRPIFDEGLQRLQAAWLECELSAYSRQISTHYRETGEKALNHLMKEHLSDLPHDQAEIIRDWTQALVGKLTNIPILGLKGVARDIGEPAVEAFTSQIAEKSNLFRA